MDINRRHALVRSAALLVSAWGNSRVAVAAGSKAGAGLDT